MIKNLLFDLGGVIIDLCRMNCVKAFEELGMSDANSLLGEYSQAGVFAGIENGSLTRKEFCAQIREIIGKDLSDEQVCTAFKKFLVDLPSYRLEHLEQLHKDYKMYMLSNTNPIMWNDMILTYFTQLGKDVNYYFDGVARSYKMGAMKPDLAVFRWVIDNFGIIPEETLFFDDSQTNLDAAAQLGFKTLLVSPGTEFLDLFNEYISK